MPIKGLDRRRLQLLLHTALLPFAAALGFDLATSHGAHLGLHLGWEVGNAFRLEPVLVVILEIFQLALLVLFQVLSAGYESIMAALSLHHGHLGVHVQDGMVLLNIITVLEVAAEINLFCKVNNALILESVRV